MNEERELRDRLEGIDVPPSRVDVNGLLDAGRKRASRRRTTRAAGGAALAIGVLLGVPPVLTGAFGNTMFDVAPSASASAGPTDDPTLAPEPSSAPARSSPASSTPARPASASSIVCQVAELPVPKGQKEIEVTTVDPTGTYILGHSYAKGGYRPILWTGGKAEVLDIPGKSVQLTDVNAAGQVVGMIDIDNEDYPFIWQNGAYKMLSLPAGSWHAYPQPQINAKGEVTLNVEPRGNSGGKDSLAIMWKPGSTKATKLPLPKGGNVYDINDDGTLIGSIYTNGSADHGWAWDQQGHGKRLATEPGQTTAAYQTRGDWATGGLWPVQEPALWNLRTGALTHLTTPTGADLAPALDGVGPGEAVNSLGWVVAAGYVLLPDGPLHLPVAKGLTPWATAVADNGLVVGMARAGDNTYVGPRAWQC